MRRFFHLLLGIFFTGAGIMHFLNPDFFVAIVPPYLPAPQLLNWLSGAIEIILGLGVLFSQHRRATGIGLILLLIAVFPANLHMAFNPHLFAETPPAILWLRLPVQGLFVFWVYAILLKEPTQRHNGSVA
tara:strand:+ start:186 stop:575 length:390 start_codon:yes stop_codon:yes gene_type:complete